MTISHRRPLPPADSSPTCQPRHEDRVVAGSAGSLIGHPNVPPPAGRRGWPRRGGAAGVLLEERPLPWGDSLPAHGFWSGLVSREAKGFFFENHLTASLLRCSDNAATSSGSVAVHILQLMNEQGHEGTPGRSPPAARATVNARPPEAHERQEVEYREGAGGSTRGQHPRLRLKGPCPSRPGGLTLSQACTV